MGNNGVAKVIETRISDRFGELEAMIRSLQPGILINDRLPGRGDFETPEQFVALAAKQAADLHGLAQLRASLRSRLQASPLMDAPRFARNMEAAYRRIWQVWCAQPR